MKMNKNKLAVGFAAVIMLLAASCSSPTPQIIEVTRQVPVTIVVTQVITQVITPVPTPTPEPTKTAIPVIVQAAPAAGVPAYSPVENCPTSYIARGIFVKVSEVGGSNALRPSPDLASAARLGYALPGEVLKVIGGPVCSGGWLVWLVETTYGLQGWTPETNGTEWWLIPTTAPQ